VDEAELVWNWLVTGHQLIRNIMHTLKPVIGIETFEVVALVESPLINELRMSDDIFEILGDFQVTSKDCHRK